MAGDLGPFTRWPFSRAFGRAFGPASVASGSLNLSARSWANGAPWLALLLTVALALRLRAIDYPFNIDELWVVRSLDAGADRNITPPLYYWMLQAVADLPLPKEWALRLPALLSALVAVALPLLAAPLAPSGLRWPRGPIWATLMAVCSPLVFYSALVKQYATEAAVAVIILVSFLRVFSAPEQAARWIPFAIVSIVACITMYPAVFLCTGTCAASLLLSLGLDADRPTLNRQALVNGVLVHAAIAGSVAVAYVFWLHSIQPDGALNASAALKGYWSPFFSDGSSDFAVRRT